jgi:hypothetical protein
MGKYLTVLVLLLIVFGMGTNFTVIVQAAPIPMESPLSGTADKGNSSDIEHFEMPLTIPNMTTSENGSVFSVRTLCDSQGQMVESYGRSITIIVTVPSLWTRTECFYVQFDVYMDGYVYAELDFVFEGFDNFPGPDEEREVYSSASNVRIDGPTDEYSLACYLSSSYSVGLKRAEVQVSGMAYYKSGGITPDAVMTVEPEVAPGMSWDWISRNWNWDYEFVARYGLADLQTYGGLPPSDDMSSTSGNPNYYWEGLPNDGYSISDSCSLFHPMWEPILYQAGYLVDNHISYPEYSAEVLTGAVHSLMTFDRASCYSETTNSDMFSYNSNWCGVCDEFSVVLLSFLRVLNIPCRYIWGYGTQLGKVFSHAWSEVYVSGEWTHCDSTGDPEGSHFFDEPWIYGLLGISFDWIRVYSRADDSRGEYGFHDGNDYNGKLHYHYDYYWYVYYDGPNAY